MILCTYQHPGIPQPDTYTYTTMRQAIEDHQRLAPLGYTLLAACRVNLMTNPVEITEIVGVENV